MADELFRVYEPHELGEDGYPFAWHGIADNDRFAIKNLVREQAGHRCVRCGHPYRCGEHGKGEWTACDERCSHQDDGPLRIVDANDGDLLGYYRAYNGGLDIARAGWWEAIDAGVAVLQAQWRILTVHHLSGRKNDCRWWNLCALCQRCHLAIQGKVRLDQVYAFEHSSWFKPYAAGYYASVYLDEDLTREETLARLDELLALEALTTSERG